MSVWFVRDIHNFLHQFSFRSGIYHDKRFNLIILFLQFIIKKRCSLRIVIEISINDTDTFCDVRVRPPAPVGLPIPIRVNGIFLVFGKIYWGIDTDMIQAIRKLLISGSETSIGTPGTQSRRTVSGMARHYGEPKRLSGKSSYYYNDRFLVVITGQCCLVMMLSTDYCSAAAAR